MKGVGKKRGKEEKEGNTLNREQTLVCGGDMQRGWNKQTGQPRQWLRWQWMTLPSFSKCLHLTPFPPIIKPLILFSFHFYVFSTTNYQDLLQGYGSLGSKEN